jgi:hypothetical protein
MAIRMSLHGSRTLNTLVSARLHSKSIDGGTNFGFESEKEGSQTGKETGIDAEQSEHS